MKYLIIGGLGFIGQHFASRVEQEGHQSLIVDNLSPQIHRWESLNTFVGSSIKVCDFSELSQYEDFIVECDYIIHLAAETGTGQSMYEIARYTEQNVYKLAKLLDYLAKIRPRNLKEFALASSRSIYGEGAYECSIHGRMFPQFRDFTKLKKKIYDPFCPFCNNCLEVQPTREDDPTNPQSIYATTKLCQENLVKNYSTITSVPVSIFRFQNVYGEGQSLNNPYTGILAIFSNLARQNAAINVFEDGSESRDFIHVSDVCMSMMKVIGNHDGIETLNVGSGKSVSVLEVASFIKTHFNSLSEIHISHEVRAGDIRHNIADMNKIKKYLDSFSFLEFEVGLKKFLDWSETQQPGHIIDIEKSMREIRTNGLMLSET